MAIKTISVKNFKSFKDVEVHLGDFNVLIGANASGKSNFIRVIEFLRDIYRHGLDNAISLQGGPGFITNLNIGPGENLWAEVVASGGDEMPGSVNVGVSRTAGSHLALERRESRRSFTIGFPKERPGFDVVEERLAVEGEFLSLGQDSKTEAHPQRLGPGEIVFARNGEKTDVNFTLPQGVSLDEYEVEPWLVPGETPARSLVFEIALIAFGSLMAGVAIYDFDPKLPKKGTQITGKAELEEDGSNLAIVLRNILQDRASNQQLTNLLQYLLPFVDGLDVEWFADKSLLFNLRETFAKNKPLPAWLISDGTISMTALIVALYFEKKLVVVIEEPERNVHPHLISRIAGMMKEASQKKQVIVTTHNPEMIRNADVSDVLLVSRDKEGFSTITRPSEREEVKVFLKNEIGLDELFAQNLLHA